MDPKELRIGNLVQYSDGGGITEVSALAMHQMSFSEWSFEPIELTEEWLIKFGFIRFENRLTIEAWAHGHPSQRFDIDFLDGKIIMASRYQEHNDNLIMGHIKYVHQLQNLYFSLTNTELKLKQ